jgi:hypothetical protein
MGRLAVVGADGKRYPLRKPTEAELDRLVALEHALIHRDRLSIRAAQAVLRDSYGLFRSVGTIHRDLTVYTCDHCEPMDDPGSREPIDEPVTTIPDPSPTGNRPDPSSVP